MRNTFRFEIDKLNASKYILACKRLGIKPEEELIHHINWVIKQSKRFMTKEVCDGWHTLLTDTSPADTPISSENKAGEREITGFSDEHGNIEVSLQDGWSSNTKGDITDMTICSQFEITSIEGTITLE